MKQSNYRTVIERLGRAIIHILVIATVFASVAIVFAQTPSNTPEDAKKMIKQAAKLVRIGAIADADVSDMQALSPRIRQAIQNKV